MGRATKRTLFCGVGAVILPLSVVLSFASLTQIDLLGSEQGAYVILFAIGLGSLPLFFLPVGLEKRIITAFIYASGTFWCVWLFSQPLAYQRLAKKNARNASDRSKAESPKAGSAK